MEDRKTSKKLTAAIIVLIILCLCLCVTTAALAYSMVTSDNNVFRTGSVSINLNDGKPVIEEREFNLQPGMTVQKDFFIENKSTCSVYYRIYFVNVSGGLADVLEVTISDGETTLYAGTASELTAENAKAAEKELAIGEKRQLNITFLFPEDTDNAAQNQVLAFDMRADAVQTNNNPDRVFD